MEVEASLQQTWRWMTDLDETPQKFLWAAIVMLAAYALGHIIGWILRAFAARIHGHARNKRAKAGTGPAVPVDSSANTDDLMIDITVATIRLFVFLGGCLVVGDIFGYYDIREARSLAIAAARGVAIVVGVWFLGAWLARRLMRFSDRLDRTTHAGGKTLFSFLSSVIRFIALAVGAIAALQQFGFSDRLACRRHRRCWSRHRARASGHPESRRIRRRDRRLPALPHRRFRHRAGVSPARWSTSRPSPRCSTPSITA